MGNNIQRPKSNDFFTVVDEEIIVDLKNYKILYVDYLDADLVHAKMYDRNAFVLPRKKEIVNNMLEYYLEQRVF